LTARRRQLKETKALKDTKSAKTTEKSGARAAVKRTEEGSTKKSGKATR
jgi:hypothetical protein